MLSVTFVLEMHEFIIQINGEGGRMSNVEKIWKTATETATETTDAMCSINGASGGSLVWSPVRRHVKISKSFCCLGI